MSNILVFDEEDEDRWMLLKALAKLASGPWVKIVWLNSGLLIGWHIQNSWDRETILKMQNWTFLAGSVPRANKGTYDIISEHMVMKPSGVTHPYVSL